MLSPAERNVLRELKASLTARFGPRLRAFKLFGSRARGEGRDDSDLDLIIQVDGVSREERRSIVDLTSDLGTEHDLVLSPLVVGEDTRLSEGILRDAVAL